MSIDVAFMSLFVRKDVLDARFPRGVVGFRERFACHAEDHYLFRLCSMDGQDFQEWLDRLQEGGLDLDQDIVAAEMSHGPERSVDGIEFIREQGEDEVLARWTAMAREEFEATKRTPAEKDQRPPDPDAPDHPRLEVVGADSEPVPAASEESDLEPAVPPRGVWEVVIQRLATPACSTTETVKLTEDGKLVVEGHDIGDLPLKVWGDEDYEYWRTVAAVDVPRVLLGLIRERFESHREIKDWLEANGVESKFSSWS